MTPALPWNVDPVALSLGPVQIRWYGILFIAGLLLAIRLGTPLARTVGLRPEQDDSLVAWVEPQVAVEARWPLDLGQLLSLPAVALGLLLLFRGSRPSHSAPSSQSDSPGDRS